MERNQDKKKVKPFTFFHSALYQKQINWIQHLSNQIMKQLVSVEQLQDNSYWQQWQIQKQIFRILIQTQSVHLSSLNLHQHFTMSEIDMTSQTLEAKQNYLHYEIIEQQYDPEQFQECMLNQKGLNLEDYTMKELVKIVRGFKGVVIEPQEQEQPETKKQQKPQEISQLTEQQTLQIPKSLSTNVKEASKQTIENGEPSQNNITQLNDRKNQIELQSKSQEKKDQSDTNKQNDKEKQKQKGKKVSINLKQMVIPQYKPPSVNGKEQSSQNVLYKPSASSIIRQQQKTLIENSKPQQSPSQLSDQSLSANLIESKQKQDLLTSNKQKQPLKQSKPVTKSFYQEDEEEDQKQSIYDKAFINFNDQSQQRQFSRRHNDSFGHTESVSQSIYIPSQNNKQPFIITKKTNISSLYKEIKSSSQLLKDGREKNDFFDGFSIKIKSFSKKQSNSIFKFPYVNYHVETTFAQSKEGNSKNSKDQTNPKSKVWKVERRFNDFKWLHDFMQRSYYGTPIPPIPGKTKMRSFDDEHLEQRMIVFEKFLNKCIHIDEIASDPMFESFLSIESREQLDAVKKKFDDKLKNRDPNLMQLLKGQQVLGYGQGMTSISQNTRTFLSQQCQLLQGLNRQLRQLQTNIKLASQNAVSASNILRQLSQLTKSNHEFQIKGGAIFDVVSEYIGELSYKLDNQAYHLKNYVANTWMYEEIYNRNLLTRIASLDRHKHVMETKFKEFHQKPNSQLAQSFADNQPSTVANTRSNELYKKTKQLYEINLSLTVQEITRHSDQDFLIICKDFSSGISKYVNQIKEEMMTGVDLMTKAMTVSEGKQLKEVQLISEHRTNPRNPKNSFMIQE